MNGETRTPGALTHHELRFRSLAHEGAHRAFPCDAQGAVDMDALTSRELLDYLFVRATVGREFLLPVVSHAA